jgi:hypothetical protein
MLHGLPWFRDPDQQEILAAPLVGSTDVGSLATGGIGVVATGIDSGHRGTSTAQADMSGSAVERSYRATGDSPPARRLAGRAARGLLEIAVNVANLLRNEAGGKWALPRG